MGKGKGIALIQRHMQHTVAALCVTERSVQPRPHLKPASRTLACSYTSLRSPSLPFIIVSTSVIHVNTWITTHLLTPKGWKAELSWLVDP